MKNVDKKKKGFTLVELLSVIAVLSLIIGLVIFVSTSVIDNTKTKSYETTINNIEHTVDNYLNENNDRLVYIPYDDKEEFEYQCITVQNLIDTGYFKENILNSKVSKDRNVLATDYIFVKKEKNTKNIVSTKYLIDEYDEDFSKCDIVSSGGGGGSSVYISVFPESWSSYKEITINYQLQNLNDVNTIGDYDYKFQYDKDYELLSDEGTIKKIKVTDNGTIEGWISKKKEDMLIAENSLSITTIDKEAPKIEPKDIIKVYGSNFDLFEGITITDNSGEIGSKKVYFNDNEITNSESLELGDNILTYVVSDKFGNESSASRKITLVVADEEFDYKEEDQIYEILADGTYIIEAYGAQGGNSGGMGGYVRAEIELKVGNIIYITTGGINGYNGGGGYQNSSYYPGGGATTVKYNDSNIVIAGGGGAKGNDGTAGAGGSGTGDGGASVGSGKGLNGSNGGGGTNSLDYKYSCNCDVCGGGSYSWCETYCTCDNPYFCGCYNCFTDYYPTYSCNCSTCTDKGKGGQGGKSEVILPAISVESSSGVRNGNGYVKIKYKLEG